MKFHCKLAGVRFYHSAFGKFNTNLLCKALYLLLNAEICQNIF